MAEQNVGFFSRRDLVWSSVWIICASAVASSVMSAVICSFILSDRSYSRHHLAIADHVATFGNGFQSVGPETLSLSPQPKYEAPTPPTESQLSVFVTKLSHGSINVLSSAGGPDGMTAVAIVPTEASQQQKVIGWVLPHMSGLLVGSLFDPNGNNLTQSEFSVLGVAPKSSVPVGSPDLQRSTGQTVSSLKFSHFVDGHGPQHITVFFDPNCIYCHMLWKEIHANPSYQSKFTITWIPVGALKPSSAGIAAAILKGGVSALNANEQGFIDSSESGALSPSNDQADLSQISANTSKWEQLMSERGQPSGTPTIVTNGNEISVGLPTQQVLESLGGSN